MKHGEEGTHSVCNKHFSLFGGKSTCCVCAEKKDCENTPTPQPKCCKECIRYRVTGNECYDSNCPCHQVPPREGKMKCCDSCIGLFRLHSCGNLGDCHAPKEKEMTCECGEPMFVDKERKTAWTNPHECEPKEKKEECDYYKCVGGSFCDEHQRFRSIYLSSPQKTEEVCKMCLAEEEMGATPAHKHTPIQEESEACQWENCSGGKYCENHSLLSKPEAPSEWEKEFDKMVNLGSAYGSWCDEVSVSEMKSFIARTAEAARKEMKEEVSKLALKTFKDFHGGGNGRRLIVEFHNKLNNL